MAGVTVNGFEIKTYDEIMTELSASFEATFGADFDTTTESPDGQLIAIFADALANQWLLAEASSKTFVPSKTYGVGLDNAAELFGLNRKEGILATVSVNLDGFAGLQIPSGSLVSNEAGDLFSTLAVATLPSTGTPCEAVNYGNLNVGVGAITEPYTLINGWTTATNTVEGIVGYETESDAVFRARLLSSTVSRGTSTLDALYSAFAANGIDKVHVVENDSDSVVDGQPAHSVRVIVQDGTDVEIAETIFNNKTVGVTTFGATTMSVLDSGSDAHDINFDRPTQTTVSVSINVRIRENARPTYEADIRNAILGHIATRTIGQDIVWSDLFVALAAEPGLAFPSILLGTPGSEAAVDFAIAKDAVAITTADDITIVAG